MKVKSKVRMGAAALLLLCAFLSLCSGSCFSNLRSALEEGGEGQLERLVEPPGASGKPIPVPILVSSSPQGAGNRVALPRCQRAPPVGENWLQLNHLQLGNLMRDRRQLWFLPSYHHHHHHLSHSI